jgi:hypothetical protein
MLVKVSGPLWIKESLCGSTGKRERVEKTMAQEKIVNLLRKVDANVSMLANNIKPSSVMKRGYAFASTARVFGLFALVMLVIQSASVVSWSQERQQQAGHTISRSGRLVALTPFEVARLDQAMGSVCTEREFDPRASVPIDEMQMKPSLPLNHPRVVEGTARAERLLPIARELVLKALTELADEYGIEPWRVKSARQRVNGVTRIRPDMELRDNASVYFHNQRTIHFGTIFLASLPSDEGMISILAHELTHIADGKVDALNPLFQQIGEKAAHATAMEIQGSRPEELTCDLIGVIVARMLIERTPDQEPFLRRIARSVEHNCVSRDITDDAHLSPRSTMKALIAIEPSLSQSAFAAGFRQ